MQVCGSAFKDTRKYAVASSNSGGKAIRKNPQQQDRRMSSTGSGGNSDIGSARLLSSGAFGCSQPSLSGFHRCEYYIPNHSLFLAHLRDLDAAVMSEVDDLVLGR